MLEQTHDNPICYSWLIRREIPTKYSVERIHVGYGCIVRNFHLPDRRDPPCIPFENATVAPLSDDL